MQNRVDKFIARISGPGVRLLKMLGYKEYGVVDTYIRSYMCLRAGYEDPRPREFAGSWLMVSLIGGALGLVLVGFGMVAEAVYVVLFINVLPFVILRGYRAKVISVREQIARDMPQMLNTLVILLNTGLSLSSALKGVVKFQDESNILIKYLNDTLSSVDKGMPLTMAWNEFANRCSTVECSNLATLVIRENTLGVKGIADSLNTICISSEQARRRQILKAGEVAKTWLLLPQTMIFASVLLLIGYPAFVTLGGI